MIKHKDAVLVPGQKMEKIAKQEIEGVPSPENLVALRQVEFHHAIEQQDEVEKYRSNYQKALLELKEAPTPEELKEVDQEIDKEKKYWTNLFRKEPENLNIKEIQEKFIQQTAWAALRYKRAEARYDQDKTSASAEEAENLLTQIEKASSEFIFLHNLHNRERWDRSTYTSIPERKKAIDARDRANAKESELELLKKSQGNSSLIAKENELENLKKDAKLAEDISNQKNIEKKNYMEESYKEDKKNKLIKRKEILEKVQAKLLDYLGKQEEFNPQHDYTSMEEVD